MLNGHQEHKSVRYNYKTLDVKFQDLSLNWITDCNSFLLQNHTFESNSETPTTDSNFNQKSEREREREREPTKFHFVCIIYKCVFVTVCVYIGARSFALVQGDKAEIFTGGRRAGELEIGARGKGRRGSR